MDSKKGSSFVDKVSQRNESEEEFYENIQKIEESIAFFENAFFGNPRAKTPLSIEQRVTIIQLYFTNEKDVNKTITLWKERFGQHLDLKPKTVEKFVRWFETNGSVRDEDNTKRKGRPIYGGYN